MIILCIIASKLDLQTLLVCAQILQIVANARQSSSSLFEILHSSTTEPYTNPLMHHRKQAWPLSPHIVHGSPRSWSTISSKQHFVLEIFPSVSSKPHANHLMHHREQA